MEFAEPAFRCDHYLEPEGSTVKTPIYSFLSNLKILFKVEVNGIKGELQKNWADIQ